MNMWLQSYSDIRKPVKIRVVDGVPVAEIDRDNHLLRLTPNERDCYLQQLALQGYNLTK